VVLLAYFAWQDLGFARVVAACAWQTGFLLVKGRFCHFLGRMDLAWFAALWA
jgi:hypothetical protein